MPLKRRFKKRVVRRPRKTYKKRGPQKFIPKASPIEMKYMDSDATNSALATTGQRYLLNGNVQGTSQNTRVGNRVNIRKIELKFSFASTTATAIKVALILDKQANAALAAMSDVFNAIGGVFYPWCVRNSINSQRFVVLKNFLITLNPNVASTLVTKRVDKYIKCNIPVQYNGGVAGTIADITSNALYLFVLCENNNGSMSYTSRCRFTDD